MLYAPPIMHLEISPKTSRPFQPSCCFTPRRRNALLNTDIQFYYHVITHAAKAELGLPREASGRSRTPAPRARQESNTGRSS